MKKWNKQNQNSRIQVKTLEEEDLNEMDDCETDQNNSYDEHKFNEQDIEEFIKSKLKK